MEIRVSIARQQLMLLDDQGREIGRWPVSTAANGAGEVSGSYQTPRGRHIVRARIGEGQPLNAVFRARRPTGEIYGPKLAEAFPGRDWVLTRILWLSGCEPGRNRLGNRDSMRRYIYIHGTPDTEPMGVPRSHGCIRMRNEHLVSLFDQVPPFTPVLIEE